MPNTLWAGNEGESFLTHTSPSFSTSTSFYDADFSRVASTGIRTSPVFGPVAIAWLHARLGNSTGSVTNTNGAVILALRDNAGVNILQLVNSGTGTLRQLQYWNGSSFINIGSTFDVPDTNGQYLDLECNIDGTTGRFAVYANGIVQASLTGNTDFFSASIYDAYMGSWGTFTARYMSEFIVADGDTTRTRLATVGVTGAGTTTNWTSGAYTDIDEIGAPTDGDFISSGTADQVDTFTAANLSSAAAALDVIAVVVNSRARNSATGPQNLQHALRVGSTDYFGSTLAPGASFTSGFSEVWLQNPDTASDWTPSDVNALEPGAKSIT